MRRNYCIRSESFESGSYLSNKKVFSVWISERKKIKSEKIFYPVGKINKYKKGKFLTTKNIKKNKQIKSQDYKLHFRNKRKSKIKYMQQKNNKVKKTSKFMFR